MVKIHFVSFFVVVFLFSRVAAVGGTSRGCDLHARGHILCLFFSFSFSLGGGILKAYRRVHSLPSPRDMQSARIENLFHPTRRVQNNIRAFGRNGHTHTYATRQTQHTQHSTAFAAQRSTPTCTNCSRIAQSRLLRRRPGQSDAFWGIGWRHESLPPPQLACFRGSFQRSGDRVGQL